MFDPASMADMLKGLQGDPTMKNQINNFWNMLNDMSENDPKAYKSFIDSNVEKGLKEQKKQQEKAEEKFTKIISDENFAFRINCRLATDLRKPEAGDPSPQNQNSSDNKIDSEISKKFVIDKEESKSDPKKVKKLPQEGKVLINLLHHEEY